MDEDHEESGGTDSRTQRSRLKSCAAVLWIVLVLLLFLAFLLIPILFHADRQHGMPEKEDEDEARKRIYGSQ